MPPIGTIVGVWDGTHCTKMRVIKHNRKTFICEELERSHSPGRQWKVHENAQYCVWGVLPDGRTTNTWHNQP